LQSANSSQDALERRLNEVERTLTKQRRITAALAAFALVGCLAASQSAEPEVVRARRFEVIDAQGRKVAAFGIGASTFQSGSDDSIGWFVMDPSSEAAATVFVGRARDSAKGRAGEDVPVAILALEASDGYVQASTGKSAALELIYEAEAEQRSVGLFAQADRTELCLGAPGSSDSADNPVDVLKLQHTSGKPTIQGWDEQGNVTIDIK